MCFHPCISLPENEHRNCDMLASTHSSCPLGLNANAKLHHPIDHRSPVKHWSLKPDSGTLRNHAFLALARADDGFDMFLNLMFFADQRDSVSGCRFELPSPRKPNTIVSTQTSNRQPILLNTAKSTSHESSWRQPHNTPWRQHTPWERPVTSALPTQHTQTCGETRQGNCHIGSQWHGTHLDAIASSTKCETVRSGNGQVETSARIRKQCSSLHWQHHSFLPSTMTGLLSKNDVSVRVDDTLPTMFGLIDVIFFHGWHVLSRH